MADAALRGGALHRRGDARGHAGGGVRRHRLAARVPAGAARVPLHRRAGVHRGAARAGGRPVGARGPGRALAPAGQHRAGHAPGQVRPRRGAAAGAARRQAAGLRAGTVRDDGRVPDPRDARVGGRRRLLGRCGRLGRGPLRAVAAPRTRATARRRAATRACSWCAGRGTRRATRRSSSASCASGRRTRSRTSRARRSPGGAARSRSCWRPTTRWPGASRLPAEPLKSGRWAADSRDMRSMLRRLACTRSHRSHYAVACGDCGADMGPPQLPPGRARVAARRRRRRVPGDARADPADARRRLRSGGAPAPRTTRAAPRPARRRPRRGGPARPCSPPSRRSRARGG